MKYTLAYGTQRADLDACYAVVNGASILRFREHRELVRRLFDFLESPRSADEVTRGVPGLADPERLLGRLTEAGALTMVDDMPSTGISIGYDLPESLRSELDPPPAETAEASIMVRESTAEMLDCAGIAWTAGRKHLPVAPGDGHRMIIGPAVVPGLTACFECLMLRRAGLSGWPEDYLEIHRNSSRGEISPKDLQLSLNLAQRLAEAAFVRQDPESIGSCLVVNLRSLSVHGSRIWSVPRCPTCSTSATSCLGYPWREPISAKG
ncbi:TOMM precursor leader peptide-binding protein [Acaricomes phytoseiuli]|uniref:TOMM precursor leader peptide-binding protein n=1 Tax=Acaricomes phytoseiuli TaxID=291968 RepID=UPI000367D096|nr:TOMM precursor leader peptide-binding protein [Acaricomes phytoseiuli]MCW1249741.1 TOMM precursor leader peptide-binding protein [Acaricomes phytoseiuli]